MSDFASRLKVFGKALNTVFSTPSIWEVLRQRDEAEIARVILPRELVESSASTTIKHPSPYAVPVLGSRPTPKARPPSVRPPPSPRRG